MEECITCSSGTGSAWMRWKISTGLHICVAATRIRYLRGKFKIFSANNLLHGNLYFPSLPIILLFSNGCYAKILKILYLFFVLLPLIVSLYIFDMQMIFQNMLILLSLLARLYFIYVIIYIMSQNILIFYDFSPSDFIAQPFTFVQGRKEKFSVYL